MKDGPAKRLLWVLPVGRPILTSGVPPRRQGERTTNPLADNDLRQSLGKDPVKDEDAPFMTVDCHFVTYQCHLACF